MVNVSRNMGRIALMAALAAVLVAGAFSFPWYTYRYDLIRESTVSSDQWRSDGFIQFYPDYSSDGRGDLTSYAGPWFDEPSSFSRIFSTEAILGALWVLAAIAFIGLVFMDFRLQSLVAGAFIFTVGLLMILTFVLRFGEALADSSYLSPLMTSVDVGFIGSHTDDWTNDSWHYLQSVNYGPSWGFGMLLLAFALQTVAFALRANVAMPSVIEEHNRREHREFKVPVQPPAETSSESPSDATSPESKSP